MQICDALQKGKSSMLNNVKATCRGNHNLLSFSLAAFIAISCASPALAQEAPAEDDTGLGEIVVTAQKRAENLQDVPIAISVLGSQGIEDRHIQSLLDLGDGAIPSLRVAPFFSRPGALIINIRGVGVLSDSNQPARDQGVGVYVDGVYLGRAQGLGTALYDVESIEVLKGPQGTLFGRNTEGGAVNIVTKRPSGEFKLNATFGAGNYGSYKAEAHLDLPEANNISLKFDGIITKRNGFVKNPFPGALDYNSFDKRGFRAEVQWKPSDTFTANYAFDVSYDATSTNYLQLVEAPVGAPATATAPAVAPNRLAGVPGLIQPRRASETVLPMPQQASIGKTNGLRLGLSWDATEQLTLKSISSYRNMQQTQFDNAINIPSLQQPLTTANPTGSFVGFQFGRYSIAPFDQDQLSQELQLIGDFDRLKFAAGALYYRENVEDAAQAFNTLQFTDAAGINSVLRQINYATQIVQRASRVRTTSVGIYGQGTYTPPIAGDAFHLTLGGRWTRDKKVGELFTINGALPVVPVNGVNRVGPVPLNASWSRFDPLVNLSVDASEDIHFYGKWSTGYKSGGANSRSLNYAPFNPETVSMFEIGAKTEFLDGRARLNVAAYTGRYKSIQLDFFGLYEDVVNGVRVVTTRTTSDTVNAPGTGKLKGFEAEFNLAPAEGLTLSVNYAYNSVKIPATLNPFPQTGGVFITVPVPIYQVYTPEHAASGSFDYALPLNGFTLRAHIDGNFSSGFYGNYTDSEFDPVTRAVRYAQPKGEKALIFNGRLAFADLDLGSSQAKLTVSIWARNLFNEQHLFYKSGASRSGVQGFFNDPRTFGIEANIKL
jgi:iron complex outermembrane recepter protein